MNYQDLKSLIGAMLGAGVLATVVWLPQAQGEGMMDVDSGAVTRADERESMRQVLAASQKMQTANESMDNVDSAIEPTSVVTQVIRPSEASQVVGVAPAPVVMTPVVQQPAPQMMPQVQPQPQVVLVQQPVQQAQMPVAAPVEVQAVSKSEMLRRARVREELKNEDILQERLEELRLRDERQRTDQVLGVTAPTGVDTKAVAALMKEEVVTVPVTERPGQLAAAPMSANAMQDQIVMSSSVASTSVSTTISTEDNVSLSLMPRAGLTSMVNSTGLNVAGRYSGGLALGVGVSDNLAFEAGYSFTEFGVASATPWIAPMGYTTGTTSETYALKQNLIDAGLKLYFLGPNARLRPFLGGGASYSKNFMNFDGRVLDYYRQQNWAIARTDYESSAFMGYVSGGLDIRVTKNISIGTVFKYYTVLTARDTALYNNAFYAPAMTAGYGYIPAYSTSGAVYDEKQAIGGSLARSSCYSVLAGVTFSF